MQNTEALQAYFGRVTPAIPELFNMAHAICGCLLYTSPSPRDA